MSAVEGNATAAVAVRQQHQSFWVHCPYQGKVAQLTQLPGAQVSMKLSIHNKQVGSTPITKSTILVIGFRRALPPAHVTSLLPKTRLA
jgi:hypothetical protein